VSVGLGFLYRVLNDGTDLDFLNVNGLSADDFNESELEVVDLIKNHVRLYSVLPSTKTVEAEWGSRFPDFPDEPVNYWSDNIIKRTSSFQILEASEVLKNDVLNTNVDGAYKKLRELYLKLQERRASNPITNLQEVGLEVLQEHDKRQVARREATIPFGFPYLDKISSGAHPGDFIAIVGKRGAGKTYFMLKMANAIHEAGKVPMVVSTEMNPVQYARRILALRNKVKFEAIRSGRLIHNKGRAAIESDLENLSNNAIPYLIMKSALSNTLEDIIVHVKEKRPDCVYVDGAYLLKSDSSKKQNRFEQYSHGADMLKLLAQETGIPVIATYQLLRKTAGGLDDVYMSDVIAQNATLVLGVKDADEQTTGDVEWNSVKYKILEVLKGREGESGRILVHFDLERMIIEEVEVLHES